MFPVFLFPVVLLSFTFFVLYYNCSDIYKSLRGIDQRNVSMKIFHIKSNIQINNEKT